MFFMSASLMLTSNRVATFHLLNHLCAELELKINLILFVILILLLVYQVWIARQGTSMNFNSTTFRNGIE